MRVLLVADIVGGVRSFVRSLTSGLASRGVEVDLALLGQDPDREFERIGVRSCQVRNLRLEWMDDPWADVDETGEWVRRLCARRRPDVLHMNTFAPVHSRTTPVLLTAHSCVLSWWRAVHGADAPAQWSRYRHLVARALKSASLLTTPSSALLDQLGAVYGALPAARVIANGEDVTGQPHDTRHRERVVICAGRIWDAGKNAELVARAAPDIDGRVVLIRRRRT
jgi:hypothetical protein